MAASAVRSYHQDLAASLVTGKSPALERARKTSRRLAHQREARAAQSAAERAAAEELAVLQELDRHSRIPGVEGIAVRRATEKFPDLFAEYARRTQEARGGRTPSPRPRPTDNDQAAARELRQIAEFERVAASGRADGVSVHYDSGERFPDLFAEYARRRSER